MAFEQSEALRRLGRAIESGRFGHAYLLAGPRASGKLDLARKLSARLLDVAPERLSSHPDFHLIEPESRSRRILVAQIRDLDRALCMKPFLAARKVGLIVDADRLQPQAANAFLKTLEEPPQGAHLFLLSFLPGALLETIVSRCIVIHLQAPPASSLSEIDQALLDRLEECLLGAGSVTTRAFRLARAFQEVLGAERERIRAELDQERKAEEAAYSKSTDGSWLEQREEQLKAIGEAAAIRRRAEMLQLFIAWFGEILRIQCGSAAVVQREPHRSAAEAFTLRQILRQVSVLEEIGIDLDRGTYESLALEAGFLKLFLSAR